MNTRFRWVIIIVSLIMIVGLYRSVFDLWNKRSIYSDRQAVVARLVEENTRLKKKLEEVRTDFFAEREAREKLGMVREGETVVLMQEQLNAKGNSSADGPNAKKEALPNWQQWWELFF